MMEIFISVTGVGAFLILLQSNLPFHQQPCLQQRSLPNTMQALFAPPHQTVPRNKLRTEIAVIAKGIRSAK